MQIGNWKLKIVNQRDESLRRTMPEDDCSASVLRSRVVILASDASAKVYLDINNPGGRRLPIAVPSFIVLEGADPAGAASEMAAVIAGDLEFSGF